MKTYVELFIHFQRQEVEAQSVNAISRAAFPVLPCPYDQILNDGQFFLYDRGVGDTPCILVFAANQVVQLLANPDDWFSDGVFEFSPEIFFQLYTIHAKIH